MRSAYPPSVLAAEEASAVAESKAEKDESKAAPDKPDDEKDKPDANAASKESDKKPDKQQHRQMASQMPRRHPPTKTRRKKRSLRKIFTAKEKASKSTKRDKVRLALLALKDSLPESAGQMGPFGEVGLDLREVTSRLEKASKDKSIAGVVLNIENPSIGRGKVEELRAAIGRFRKAGKKIYAQLESAMPADYLIACACDEIVMPETGVLVLPGVHAEATFYKGLLGKVGIQADFIHMGAYKGAAEPYTREKFSEPVRENMNVADRQHVRRHGHDHREEPPAVDRTGQGSHRPRADYRDAAPRSWG